mgnify:CR=1 FL=1
MSDRFRIGIVSGKLGDVDGVSLEVAKWIDIIGERLGHKLLTIAGSYKGPVHGIDPESQLTLPEIRFDSERQRRFEHHVFPHMHPVAPHIPPGSIKAILDEMQQEGASVATEIDRFVQDHEIDVLVGQNTNAMPMTILGGIAMHRVATISRVATIFHHHDFWWERSRFSNNHIETLLNKIMPPVDIGLEHVVISSYAAHILSSLKRVRPFVIPNCEDFDNAVGIDEYNGDFRAEMGFREDDVLFVQPTRIVPRKRIEDSVELVGRFQQRFHEYRGRVHYIISLYQGDEPDQDYIGRIKKRAAELDVPIHLISDRVSATRGTNTEGKKTYTNRDVLANADIVTYLPVWEGFGNALLEAMAARVPIAVTTYLVYKTDIMPTGFKNIEIRDHYDTNGRLIIPDDALETIAHLLTHPEDRRSMVDHNFSLASRDFGFSHLEGRLEELLREYGDEIRASRKRRAKRSAHYSV